MEASFLSDDYLKDCSGEILGESNFVLHAKTLKETNVAKLVLMLSIHCALCL